MLCIGAGQRAAAADLQPVVLEQTVIETQRARIGKEGARAEVGRLQLGLGQRPGHHRIRQDRHDLVLEQRVQALPGVTTGAYRHPAGAHRAARSAQVVHVGYRLPALYRAGRVHAHTQRARPLEQAEGELERVDAHTFGLQHGACGVALVAIVAPHLLGTEHARVVAESLAPHARFVAQVGEFFRPVRQVEVTAIERVAIDLCGELLEILEAGADLAVEPFRDIEAPAPDPLRAGEPPAGVLALATTAARTAPGALVGLQHHGADAMLLRQVQRGRDAGRARADHHHVGVDVAGQGAVVGRWRAGAGNPVGGRVGTPGARGFGDQRIVFRIVLLVGWRCAAGKLHWVHGGHGCSGPISAPAGWAGPCERRSSGRSCRCER